MLTCMLAVCLQLGVGYGHANPQDAGIWWMSGPQYSHSMNMNSTSFKVGAATDHWRLGIESLGKFRIDSTAIASDNPSDVFCAPKCQPISHWHGQGRVFGAYLERAFNITSHWTMLAGAWGYRATWDETIPDFQAYVGPTIPKAYGPISVNVSANSWSPGGIVGVEYSLGHLSIETNLRMVEDRGPDRSGLKNWYTNSTLSWRF
jgi:hypothetical protein